MRRFEAILPSAAAGPQPSIGCDMAVFRQVAPADLLDIHSRDGVGLATCSKPG
jgi:hypothetical protein